MPVPKKVPSKVAGTARQKKGGRPVHGSQSTDKTQTPLTKGRVSSGTKVNTRGVSPRDVSPRSPDERKQRSAPQGARTKQPGKDSRPQLASRQKSPANSALRKERPFRVEGISPGEVSALILADLTRNHSDICNFTPEVALVRQGEIFLAYVAIADKCEQITDVSARHVWVKAQALASVKKVSDPAYDRYPETAKKWWACEHRCKRINQRFTAWMKRAREQDGKTVPFKQEMVRMNQLITYVLGNEVPLDGILQQAHYGPGSTVGVSGRSVHYVAKTASLDCTGHAIELAARSLVHDKGMWAQLGHDPVYAHLESAREGFVRSAIAAIREEQVDYDKLMFIHKGLLALRSIGAQPTMNGMLQLGVDPLIKQRLNDALGIDLQDQSLNQRLAFQGSLHHGEAEPWCTLDKTDASNTIALILLNLFPLEWAKLLRRLRSPQYLAPKELGGEKHTYQMYAGMGNGTTFAVESLIFAAVAYATSQLPLEEFVAKRQYAIYGDDVVLRRSHALRYMELAEYLGFTISSSKSFLFGPFRESCGADYWNGVNVRPAYVKSDGPLMHPLELIGTHNTLVDHPNWKLLGAAEGIRKLFARKVSEVIPTDPQGGLGFRPTPGSAGYTIVRDTDGAAVLSPAWQRPRFYVYNVRAKLDKLESIGPWTQLAIALNKGNQAWAGRGNSQWSLPLRDLVNIRLVAETDMDRKDLVQMLVNQLGRLSQRMSQPWWNESRGI